MDKVVHLYRRTLIEKVFAACALGFLFGCGAKNGAADDTTSADAIKTPVTVEQAARVLDRSTFPLMDGAKFAGLLRPLSDASHSMRGISEPLMAHLIRRVRQREISTSQLGLLARWLATDPEVPEGQSAHPKQ
jgi:hypothetical protein